VARIPEKPGRLATQYKNAALYGLVAFTVLVGCGGVGTNPPVTGSGLHGSANASPTPNASASPSPTPSPTPTPNPLHASPAALDFGGVNGSQTITVKETGFTGTFTATSNDTTIVAVAPPTVAVSTLTNPASTGVFVVTSIGIGANLTGITTITITDGTYTVTVPVTVSVTSGQITYRPPPPSRPKS
jgi:hypothetical protein